MNKCPVCGYDRLEFPPANFSICACCGTEFGYDDRLLTHYQLRERWIVRGCIWFDEGERKPIGWNAYVQMMSAGLSWAFPGVKINIRLQSNATIEQEGTIRFGARLPCVA
jgi:hypothetical protein